jgi:hypothetical protein
MQSTFRVVVSRDGADADHEAMREMTGLLTEEPRVGEPLRVWRDDGKLMRTSPIRRVNSSGSHWTVDTRNSRYHLDVSPVGSRGT